MKIIKIIIIVIVAVLLVGYLVYSRVPKTHIGSGNVISVEREVEHFSMIEMKGIGNLHVSQGEKTALKIEAEDNVIPHITSEIKSETLEISLESGDKKGRVTPTKPIDYYVTVVDLSKIKMAGSGSLTSEAIVTDTLEVAVSGSAKGDLLIETKEFYLRANGAGDFRFAGTTDSQEVRLNGAGTYRGNNLRSGNALFISNGTSSGSIYATETLDVTINGQGTLLYAGSPEITQNISGQGKIKKLIEAGPEAE